MASGCYQSKMAAESAAQLFSRLGCKQSLSGLDNQLFSDIPQGIKPGDIIEFYGSEGCGKTEMLLHLIANSILPQTWRDLQLGGRGVSVVFVDTDFHFQLLRLVTVMEYRIETAVTELNKRSSDSKINSDNNVCHSMTEKDIEDFIKACLTRLYIVRCNSSLELLASLISLEQMLTAKTEICVVMIDSLSAFYWIDRSTGGESTTDQEENIKAIFLTIQKYAKEFHLVVIVTTHAIFTSSHKSKQTTTDNYFCKSWLGIVQYKYLFKCQNDTRATSSQPVFIAQRTIPRSNQFKKFYVTEKGIQFSS